MKDLKDPIITSMIDNDDYKFKMGQVVFHDFPEAIVTYEFINRGKTAFPPGFAEQLKHQIDLLAWLSLTNDEASFLETLPGIRPSYVEWFKGYRYNPDEVTIHVYPAGTLSVSVKGPWFRTIFWEVPLMAIISELFFFMTGQRCDDMWLKRLNRKASLLDQYGCNVMEFGTRRRYSLEVQKEVVFRMKQMKRGFLGTSNVHLAHKLGVPSKGTSAHEMVMGLSAKYGISLANKRWSQHWSQHYNGLNGIALTDTFTTEVFLRDWDSYYTRLFDGVRQDSDDPYKWADQKVIPHYARMGVSIRNKSLVFSDNLMVDDANIIEANGKYNFIPLHLKYQDIAIPVGGIGTFLSNDVGVKPLNMVIKMTSANFGRGHIDVVKLSDNAGKHTGTPEAIAQAKKELGL